MKPASVEVVTAGLWRVVTRARSLLALGAGAGVAVLAHTWPLTVALAAGWVLVLGAQCRDMTLWREVVKDLRRRPVPLPCESDLTDEGARRHLARVLRARRERNRALECGTERPSEAALSLVETAGELEAQVAAQIRSLDCVGRYLEARVVREGLPCAGALPSLLAPGPDHAWARRMHIEHAAGLTELAALRAELDARLEAATETLAMLPCRLAIMGMQDRADVTCPMDRDLRERLQAQVSSLVTAGWDVPV
jgi:hypothetical protein